MRDAPLGAGRALARGLDPRKALARVNASLGIAKHVTPHGLRHTFATLAHAGGRVQPGAPTRTIQAWLGHSMLEQTNNYPAYPSKPSGHADSAELSDSCGCSPMHFRTP